MDSYHLCCLFSSDRQHLSYDVCLEIRGKIIRTVLYCVLKLCTVISTLRWAVLTVLWIEFCHTGPISLCIDLVVFICMYFACFCFILHFICVVLLWALWGGPDGIEAWSVGPYLSSVLWHCWLGHLTRKNPSLMWSMMCLVGH